MFANRVLPVLALLQLAGHAHAGRNKREYDCSQFDCSQVGHNQMYGSDRGCNQNNWVEQCCGEENFCTQDLCPYWKPYLNPAMMEPEPVQCSNNVCSRSECCLSHDVCTAMDCDEEYPFFCGYGWGCDGECDASKCCQKVNFCTQEVCPSWRPYLNPAMMEPEPVPCTNNQCGKSECCLFKDVCTLSDCSDDLPVFLGEKECTGECDAHQCCKAVCSENVCGNEYPIFSGVYSDCEGPCDAAECCKKDVCTALVCDEYYPNFRGEKECYGMCETSECCEPTVCPESPGLTVDAELASGICRADGATFHLEIGNIPDGFSLHEVVVSGDMIGYPYEVELTPNEKIYVQITLTSVSSGVCNSIHVEVTPTCRCETTEDCHPSDTGLICCKESNVCDEFNTGACGDPHMTGFLGQKFDFTGKDGQWYSLIADVNMNVNMRVTSPIANLPEITYITGLSVLTTDADDFDHSIVIEVKDPHSLESSCPAGVSPCLANGSLRVVLDGEEALNAPGTVVLGEEVQVSAVNLPGACRSFGFEKYWDSKRLESARHGRRLGEPLSMSEWVLDDPTATNMEECTEYVARAELVAGGMFTHQSEHASFQIVTPKATIRLSHGRLHQVAMRDPTDQYDLPDHVTWQMNMAVDHNEVSRDAKGILGETFVPTRGSDGKAIMTGMEAIRGQQDDYLVDGALGTDFIQDAYSS